MRTQTKFVKRKKMEKLKKATKRITAIAASAVMITSGAFGAGLGSYPGNFVADGKFNGQVVIGSSAAAIDTAAANTIIENLKSEFAGASEQVKITYKSATAGEEVRVLDTGSMHKFGDSLSDARELSFDDRDFNVLKDGTIRLGTSNKDYTQKIELGDNGVLEHSFIDRLENQISTKLFFKANDNIMNYTLSLKSPMNVSTLEDKDIIGKKLTIMGNDFTIGGYEGAKKDTNAEFTELKLLGGAQTVALGDGESATIDGHEVKVLLIGDDKVQLSVNGQSRLVDLYDVENIGGVNIAVVSAIAGRGDTIKGYTEIILGGQEIVIKGNTGNEIEINGERISDVFEDYVVYGKILGSGEFAGLEFTYKTRASEGIALRAGEVFEDKVFNAVGIKFDGINDVDYTTTELSVSGRDLRINAETLSGDSLNRVIANAVEYKAGATDAAAISLIGARSSVPMLLDGFDASTGWKFMELNTTAGAIVNNVSAPTEVLFAGLIADVQRLIGNASAADDDDVAGFDPNYARNGLTFFAGDGKTQYFYEISGYKKDATDEAKDEYTIRNLLTGSTVVSNRLVGTIANNLHRVEDFTNDGDHLIDFINVTTNNIALKGHVYMNLSGVNNVNVSTNAGSKIEFTYNEADIRPNVDADLKAFNVTFGYHTGDRKIQLNLEEDFLSWNGGSNGYRYVSDSNRDMFEFVDKFGNLVSYDDDRNDKVTLKTPSKQVEAKVFLVAGEVGSTNTVTVAAANAESKRAELIAAGNTIVSSESAGSSSVEFDVTAPVLDTQASGANMIVVGGPAVNAVARQLMGIGTYTVEQAGVNPGEGVIRYFASSNSVLVYGYSGEDTVAAASRLNDGGLSGDSVNVQ